MIKKTITYTNWNDESVTEDLYFHITKSEILDNVDLRRRFEELKNRLEGAERDLSEDDVREVISLIRVLLKLSYGVRSEDGKRFKKSDELYLEFSESAAYDAVLFDMFENPNRAVSFMTGIIPKDLMDKVELQRAKNQALEAQQEQAFVAEETARIEAEGGDVEETPEETIARLKAELSKTS